MAIFIARDAALGIHYFVRVLDSKSDHDAHSVDMYDFINSLTTAKSHKQVAAAVENAPLLLGEHRGPHQLERVMSVGEFQASIVDDRLIVPVDAGGLAQEMFLASSKPLRANRGSSSPAASLDVTRSDNAALLDSMSRDAQIVIEPIADWMTFRNTLAIGAALLANIENPPKDGRVLDACGFEARISREKFDQGKPVFCIPFKHALRPALLYMRSEDDRDLDYLFSLYEDTVQHVEIAVGIADGIAGPMSISDDGMVCVGTERIDSRMSPHMESASLARISSGAHLSQHKEGAYRLYLCVKQHASQLEMAKEVVVALWRLNQEITSADGFSLGRAEDHESLFNPDAVSMEYEYHSLASLAWGALCFHAGRRLTACKHCGCGSFDPLRGRPREYCSASCGIQDRETA